MLVGTFFTGAVPSTAGHIASVAKPLKWPWHPPGQLGQHQCFYIHFSKTLCGSITIPAGSNQKIPWSLDLFLLPFVFWILLCEDMMLRALVAILGPWGVLKCLTINESLPHSFNCLLPDFAGYKSIKCFYCLSSIIWIFSFLQWNTSLLLEVDPHRPAWVKNTKIQAIKWYDASDLKYSQQKQTK